MLALQIDRTKLRLINGDDSVTSAELLTLQAAEPVHNVSIKLCETLFGVCQRCGFVQDTGKPVPPPDPFVPPDPTPPGPRLLPPPSAVSEGVDNA
jgi:hypothetical protein